MLTTACQPLLLLPRKDHNRLPSLHHKIHKGCMEKGGSCNCSVSGHKGRIPQCHPKPSYPRHEILRIPPQYTDWIYWKVSGRCTSITFNSHTSNPRMLRFPRL